MSEPDYYAKNGLSPMQAFEKGLLSKDELIGFCKGNVIKYTIRAGEKTDDPLLDIVKAMDYLHYLHKALKIEDRVEVTDDGSDLETKLSEVQESINEFKKEYGITDNDSSSYTPATSLRPKPVPDERLNRIETFTGKPYKHNHGRNWLARLKEKTGAL